MEQWQLAENEAGQSELDAGQFVSHDEVGEWRKSWQTERELDAPQ
jgi:predicted transcriptional regulator